MQVYAAEDMWGDKLCLLGHFSLVLLFAGNEMIWILVTCLFFSKATTEEVIQQLRRNQNRNSEQEKSILV